MNNPTASFSRVSARHLAASLVFLAGCGGSSAPHTINMDNLSGVYISTDNNYVSVMRVIPTPPSAYLIGYTYATMEDAKKAIAAGFPNMSPVGNPTGEIGGTISYTDKTAPHANSLTASIRLGTSNAYSGSASLDAHKRIYMALACPTATPEKLSETWVRVSVPAS